MTAPISRERLELFARKLAEYKRRQARREQSERGGLLKFVRYFWKVLEPERELVEGWALSALCEHYEAVAFGDINRLLVNVPPGFMKSLLLNVFFPAWIWGALGKPHIRFLAFSYSSTLTERDNGKFRDLLISTEYQNLYGKLFAVRSIGVQRVDNNKTGWKVASSVGATTTGLRADYVLADDLHSVAEAESDVVRKSTVRWFIESMSNRLNDLDESSIIVLGQRVHESDVSGEIVEAEMGYCHLMIPWEYDTERHCETEIGWSDPRETAGEPAWPERFSEEAMALFKSHPFMWASQYQQSPEPRGGGIIKRDSWQPWDKDTWPSCSYVIASLDGAFTEKKENDPSALTIWGVFHEEESGPPASMVYPGLSMPGMNVKRREYGSPKVMLMYAWQGRLALNALVRLTAALCTSSATMEIGNKEIEELLFLCNRGKIPAANLIRMPVDRLLIEGKANGHDVASEMARLFPNASFGVEVVDPTKWGDKIARAYAVQHMFDDGMVYAPDRKWADMVIGDCAVFPKGEDHLVDATTQALRYLRLTGLLQRKDEYAKSLTERLTFKSRERQLYDA